MQDTRIADGPSIDISRRVFKYQDLRLHDGALWYNLTFTKPTENQVEYTISAVLNMGWCSHDKSDWIHGGDYLTTTSFGIEISDKKDLYEADIEVEHYQKSKFSSFIKWSSYISPSPVRSRGGQAVLNTSPKHSLESVLLILDEIF